MSIDIFLRWLKYALSPWLSLILSLGYIWLIDLNNAQVLFEMKYAGKLGLVRHGETYANVEKVWHGHTDTELTPRGLRQASLLGEHFHQYMKPDVIYASPLQRAKMTAEAIAARLSFIRVSWHCRAMASEASDE